MEDHGNNYVDYAGQYAAYVAGIEADEVAGDESWIVGHLMRYVRDVSGVRILDAGCGEGYLTRKLASLGAVVAGVDVSGNLVEIARSSVMNDSQIPKPKRLSREVIYESPWVNLYADEVVFPDRRVVDRHYFLEFEKEAVSALVVNAEQQILMIQAYRYTTDTIEWSVPAGGIDLGESIVEAAQREVQEETGYKTECPELIYTYNPMNGMSNKVFQIVRCNVLQGSGKFDEIRGMIAERKIKDGFALTALLLQCQ